MSWMDLFFSFDGRIGRRQWWTGTLLLLLFSTLGSLAVNPAGWGFDGAAIGSSPEGELLLDLACLIPGTALNIKRFNDRGWPQWMPYGLALILLLLLLAQHFKLILASADLTTLDVAISIATVVVWLLVVIDNGMLRGVRGPNKHGPDPVGLTSSLATGQTA